MDPVWNVYSSNFKGIYETHSSTTVPQPVVSSFREDAIVLDLVQAMGFSGKVGLEGLDKGVHVLYVEHFKPKPHAMTNIIGIYSDRIGMILTDLVAGLDI